MVERIGSKKLYDTCRDLGFGSKTGINLKGEVTGKLSPYTDWSTVSLGQIAMGHEVGVTAIQIAAAYCAIANGGFLVKPRLIRQIIDQNNSPIFSEETKVIRRIADVQTMKEIRHMLRGVIIDGTGENASISGWKIAGKTGTAQKWKDGKYSNKQFISNFIGFFPYDDPKILTFIMLDEPSQPFHWGSEGAAVAFNRVVKRIINMDNTISPPNNKKYASLKKLNNPLNKKIEKKEKMEQQNNHLAFSPVEDIYGDKTRVPEIRGFSMRKAMRVLRNSDLDFKIQGTGKVSWQSPRPGTIVEKETICVIGLE
jgi:membrane peptidoglycan carboxypeptidase